MPELPSMNFQGEEPQPKDFQTFGEYLEASKKFRAKRLTEQAEEEEPIEEEEEEPEEEGEEEEEEDDELDLDFKVDDPS